LRRLERLYYQDISTSYRDDTGPARPNLSRPHDFICSCSYSVLLAWIKLTHADVDRFMRTLDLAEENRIQSTAFSRGKSRRWSPADSCSIRTARSAGRTKPNASADSAAPAAPPVRHRTALLLGDGLRRSIARSLKRPEPEPHYGHWLRLGAYRNHGRSTT
jgi:hypothetical protein